MTDASPVPLPPSLRPPDGLLRLDGDPAAVQDFLRELQLDTVLGAAGGDYSALQTAVVRLCVNDPVRRAYAGDLALGLLQSSAPGAAAVGLRLLRLLAQDGLPLARFNLAMECFAGRHAAPDPEAGNRLLQQLVDAGGADATLLGAAHCALADSHAMGRGTPADPQRALAAYEQAAACGSADGAYNAGLIHHSRFAPGGEQRVMHLERAAACYEMALTLGSTLAYYNLAIIRLLAGVPGHDPVRGLQLLQQGVATGDARARQALDLLHGA